MELAFEVWAGWNFRFADLRMSFRTTTRVLPTAANKTLLARMFADIPTVSALEKKKISVFPVSQRQNAT